MREFEDAIVFKVALMVKKVSFFQSCKVLELFFLDISSRYRVNKIITKIITVIFIKRIIKERPIGMIVNNISGF